MMDNLAEWSTNSTDAIKIYLVAPSAGVPKTQHTFKPKITYAIFGDDENIAGYQGLKISIRYNACDMRPCLQITYSKKMKATRDGERPTDLKELLQPYLPKTAFEKSSIFDAAICDPSYSSWKPPGELWETIQSGNQTFEVWKGSLVDLAVQQMVRRVQILVPLFIEGGTCIEMDEPEWSLERWSVFFLYLKRNIERDVSPYIFMGYSTVYRYFFIKAETRAVTMKTTDVKFPLPELPFSLLPCRSRISQFVILPPFQGAGNGSRFYNAIFDYYLKESQTIEITVEDPNEAFDDLRDLNDLARLRTLPEFTKLRINTDVVPRPNQFVPREILDVSALDMIRKKIKIAPRQFARVVEMQLLSRIPINVRQVLTLEQERKRDADSKTKQHEYRLWKLLTKTRLYKHNRDTLIQLDRPERIEKLDQALGSVEEDYARLLISFDKRSSPKAGDGALNTQSDSKRPGTGDDEHVSKRLKI